MKPNSISLEAIDFLLLVASDIVAILRSNYHRSEGESGMVSLALSLNGPAKFITWGFISVSVPNLIMIGLIIVFFALALVLPFPSHKQDGK
ncbi:MAG: hypothetical protein NTU82_05845 [Actinobacteria bacterium]|nr:hypothetical protein [Actinomycetota bacterium]